MIMNRRAKQGGSAVIFVAIGFVFLISLVGSMYLLKNRGEQVRKEQAIEAYEKDEKVASDKNDKAVDENVNKDDDKTVDKKDDEISQATPVVTELPATGPDLILYKSFVIGSISLAFIYYFISLRRRRVSF